MPRSVSLQQLWLASALIQFGFWSPPALSANLIDFFVHCTPAGCCQNGLLAKGVRTAMRNAIIWLLGLAFSCGAGYFIVEFCLRWLSGRLGLRPDRKVAGALTKRTDAW